MRDQAHFVYRLFDAQGRLLYVGQTSDVRRRLREHRAVQPWFAQVAEAEVETYPTRAAALAQERAQIAMDAPLHNVRGHLPATA